MMYIERREIKRAAKDAMRWARPNPMLAALVYVLISAGISVVVAYFMGLSGARSLFLQPGGQYHSAAVFSAIYAGPYGALAVFCNIFSALVLSVLQYGVFAVYPLGVSRRQFSDIRSFFAGFERPVRIILVHILKTLFMTLWTMLFFFPGIIAFYRYRLALFLIADDPGLGALEAIRRSKQYMRGYKWQAFALDLSFLGWWVLTPFTLGILTLWVAPYATISYANFYRAVMASVGGRQQTAEPGPGNGPQDER